MMHGQKNIKLLFKVFPEQSSASSSSFPLRMQRGWSVGKACFRVTAYWDARMYFHHQVQTG